MEHIEQNNRRKEGNRGRRKSDTIEPDFFEKRWENTWTNIKTVVDVVKEPLIILDKDLRVLVANNTFYKTFQVKIEDTVGVDIYALGNGQWNIPLLKKLLEKVISHETHFNGFEVRHDFPTIGKKVMILNAREIHTFSSDQPERIILLTIDDVTAMMDVADSIADHVKNFEITKEISTTEISGFSTRNDTQELDKADSNRKKR